MRARSWLYILMAQAAIAAADLEPPVGRWSYGHSRDNSRQSPRYGIELRAIRPNG
jgi:hypothetical protein